MSLGNLGETLAVYAPHGPSAIPGDASAAPGRQWFRDMGWTFRDPKGLEALLPQLDAFIGQIATSHGIPTKHIALLGFSQGAMTLLYSLPQLANQPAAVICCSGTISVAPPFTPEPTTKPPLLLIHGADDDVLPADNSVEAAALYRAHGYTAQLALIPRLGHGIDATALAHISVFLQKLWAPEAP